VTRANGPPRHQLRSPSSVRWSRKHTLIITGASTIAFDIAILILDQRMRDAGGPSILGFEFAVTHTRAAQILAEWGSTGRDAAHTSLIIDYGFMLSYGAFFTLAGLATRDLARRRSWRTLAALGVVLPFFAAGAAMFDAIENVFLLRALAGTGGESAPLIATICASIKFTLITLAIAYVLVGLGRRLLADVRPAVGERDLT